MTAWTTATGSGGVPSPLAVTANRTSSLTQNIKSATASLSVATSAGAYFPSQNTLRYVGISELGAAGILSSDLVTRKYVDAYQAQPGVAVTQNWLNTLLTSSVSDILNPATIDIELAKYATKKQVSDDQLNYFDKTLLGAASVNSAGTWTKIGLAKTSGLGKLNKVPSGGFVADQGHHIPDTIPTDNLAKFYDGMALAQTQGTRTFTTEQTVIKNNDPQELRVAKITLPDPGYKYYPMNFVYVQGRSGSTADPLRTSGTGNTGLISVYSETNSKYYAYGTCTDSPKQNWHIALPYGTGPTPAMVPKNKPDDLFGGPLSGPITLLVGLSNYTPGSYIFSASGLTWVIVLMPVVGG